MQCNIVIAIDPGLLRLKFWTLVAKQSFTSFLPSLLGCLDRSHGLFFILARRQRGPYGLREGSFYSMVSSGQGDL